MIKKYAIILLVVLTVNAGFGTAVFGQSPAADKTLTKAKAKVVQISGKSKKNIAVKLKDGSKVKGLLTTVGDDAFDVVDAKTGKSVNLPFAQVERVNNGDGLSLGSKIVIGAVVGTAAALGLTYLVISAALD